MPLTPGYGETPLPDDELAALLPDVVLMLGKPVTRAAVYDLEQGIQQQVAEEWAQIKTCRTSRRRSSPSTSAIYDCSGCSEAHTMTDIDLSALAAARDGSSTPSHYSSRPACGAPGSWRCAGATSTPTRAPSR
jgi:hypothetical protein